MPIVDTDTAYIKFAKSQRKYLKTVAQITGTKYNLEKTSGRPI